MNALQYYVNCFNHRLSRPLSSIWTSRVTRNGQILIRLKFMVIASVDVLSDDDVGVQSPQSAPSTSAPPAPAGSPPVAGPVKPDAKAEKAAAAKVLPAAKKTKAKAEPKGKAKTTKGGESEEDDTETGPTQDHKNSKEEQEGPREEGDQDTRFYCQGHEAASCFCRQWWCKKKNQLLRMAPPR